MSRKGGRGRRRPPRRDEHLGGRILSSCQVELCGDGGGRDAALRPAAGFYGVPVRIPVAGVDSGEPPQRSNQLLR